MDDDLRVQKVGEMIASSMSAMIVVFDEISKIKDARKRKQALIAVLGVVQVAREAVMDTPTSKDDVPATPGFKL